MAGLLDRAGKLIAPAARFGAAAQNALEIARFGGLDTGEEASPFDVVEQHRVYKLRHYFPRRRKAGRPPVILVPPLMLSAEVYDVAPATSAVAVLAEHGADPWVVDFGSPEHEEGGLERTLADHVLAVSHAVDRVRERVGRDVHLAGYSQGGMFCYQAGAYRRSEGLDSVITFGSPVDTRAAMPLGLPADAAKGLTVVADRLFRGRPVPAWMSRIGFRLLDPAKSLRSRIDFVRQLHNREALLPRENQRRFLEGEGWVAWPGPAMLDFLAQFVAHNRMLSGGFVIEDKMVTLADLTCPVLCFVGEVDEIAPAAGVRAIRQAAPRAEIYEVSLQAGHFGLVVGSSAARTTWPTVADWAHWRDDAGERPESVRELEEPADDESAPAVHVGYGLELAGTVAVGAALSTVRFARQSQRTLRAVADEALHQLPRLARLERARADAQISVALLLDEQARRAPDDVFFLFEGRGHTYMAAKRRIDNIVRGLISLGVRQGEHVGVLMSTRPSALAVVAALNRLGAVVVLLRPGGPTAREVEIGQVTRIIADPEHGPEAKEATSVPVLVLGGGGRPRDLGFGLTDMERIDPDEIQIPAWYAPNPGRAQDLAFILFTGQGESVRANRITNRRWALSAFGTASAAALSSSDTVYSVTPINHPSAILTSIGGAVAGGARLAMASSFDGSTFWEEVRRYGVTIVSYTWTLVHDLVEAPPDPAEPHHPVRLFIGSGMPKGLWRRTRSRFAPAGVLEFYASTEGEAVLVNLSGKKIGAKGRQLPGSAEVRVVRYDTEAGQIVTGEDGLAIECDTDEVGMLLARVDRDHGVVPDTVLRGLFTTNDAWLATGDLFRRDADGDHWLVDHVAALIHTGEGMIPSITIEEALTDVEAVDLAVAYGVASDDEGTETIVAALSVRKGHDLEPEELRTALGLLDPESRPAVIRIVDEIPVTTWYRPLKQPLRAEGLPAEDDESALWLDPETGAYGSRALAASR